MRSPHSLRIRRTVVAGVCLALLGCVDLEVENTSAPDRSRALANANDVEAFIGGLYFPSFHNAMQTEFALRTWQYMSSEFTATLNNPGQLDQLTKELEEPRVAHNNAANLSPGAGPFGPRNFWASMGSVASIANEGLQVLDDGMVLREGSGANAVDVTPRARAFAKFMQGWAWGAMGVMFDRFHIIPETTRLPPEPAALETLIVNSLVPSDEVIAAAVGALEAAVAIAQQNPDVVHFPGGSVLWFGSPTTISSEKFIQMANTVAARILVQAARTPAERAQVDWNKVLQLTANGLQSDFEFQLTTQRIDNYLLRIQNNTTGGQFNGRWDYRSIGPADQSGAYQAWIGQPVGQRDRFDIVTPDRRITGPTPQSDGSYTRYRADNNGFVLEKGAYFLSAYQWSRQAINQGLTGTQVGHNTGSHARITADENNLLRAEALLRTGALGAAVDLINITRTREQRIGNETYPGLPPLTIAGVPEVDGVCVPRKENGTCGDLLTALRYERMIELAGIDMIRGYADSRGFGILADGTPLEFPVPGNVLMLHGLPGYSYGGLGGEGAAVFAPAELP